jgi:anti-anti-sigma factor
MRPPRWDAAGMELFGTGALDITSSGPDSVRLALFGEFDRANVGELEAAVFAALRRPVRFVDLDLTAVTFVDARFLTALVGFLQEIEDRHGRLRLYANRSIHRTLEIAGLAPLFDVVDQSEDEVRAHLVTG